MGWRQPLPTSSNSVRFFVDVTGSTRTLGFPALVIQSQSNSSIHVSIEDVLRDKTSLVRVVFSSVEKDHQATFEYLLSPTEGYLPVEISLQLGSLHSRVFVTKRRNVDGKGWIPFRSVKVQSKEGKEDVPVVVETVEVKEFDTSLPTDAELAFKMPKLCTLHLDYKWNSQFVVDVEKTVDLTEVKKLINTAQRIANGEPRRSFLEDPKSVLGNPVTQASGSRYPWPRIALIALNVGSVIAFVVIVLLRKQRDNRSGHPS